MNKQQTISAIEAVLFASGDPISIDRLSQTFEIKPEEVEKYQNYAVKAVEAGNDGDARKFLEKKASLSTKQASLQQAYELAAKNASDMRNILHSANYAKTA